MTRHLVIVVIAGALLGAGAPAASADWGPGQTPAGARVAELVPVALGYWRAQGLDVEAHCPAGIEVLEVDDLGITAAGDVVGGRAGGCAAAFRRSYVRTLARRGLDVDRCLLVTHELGHALGLPHSDAGVMRDLPTIDDAPPACERFERDVVRRRFERRARSRPRARRARAGHRLNRSWATASLRTARR